VGIRQKQSEAHPFDLPKMDAFVRAQAEHLGLTARHWAQQRDDSKTEVRSYFDAEEVRRRHERETLCREKVNRATASITKLSFGPQKSD
jgi:hypothetical protein